MTLLPTSHTLCRCSNHYTTGCRHFCGVSALLPWQFLVWTGLVSCTIFGVFETVLMESASKSFDVYICLSGSISLMTTNPSVTHQHASFSGAVHLQALKRWCLFAFLSPSFSTFSIIIFISGRWCAVVSQVFSWGSNYSKQLGLDKPFSAVPCPIKVCRQRLLIMIHFTALL